MRMYICVCILVYICVCMLVYACMYVCVCMCTHFAVESEGGPEGRLSWKEVILMNMCGKYVNTMHVCGKYENTCACVRVYTYMCMRIHVLRTLRCWEQVVAWRQSVVKRKNHDMGWLRSVRSFKLYVSFAKEPYKRDDILQKRPIIPRSLLVVATPYISIYVANICVCIHFV